MNVSIPEPQPEEPAWFSGTVRAGTLRCDCGAHLADYSSSHYGITFAGAAEELRELNQEQEVAEAQGQLSFRSGKKDEAPGGYRSRGAILWMMRVQKLRAFYEEHAQCWDWCEDPTRPGCDDLIDDTWEQFLVQHPESPYADGDWPRRFPGEPEDFGDDPEWIPF